MTPTLDALAFRHRASLLAFAAAPLVWATLAPGRAGPRPEEVAVGAAIVLAGAALRLAAIRRLGKRARVVQAKTEVLVREGPYAWLRNPLYVAALLVLLGFGLVTGLGAWALAPAGAAWLVYDRVVRHEERVLAASQGPAFAAFAAAVPRWRPTWPAVAPSGLAPVAWPEVLRREWRLLAGIPLGLAGAALVRPLGAPGWVARGLEVAGAPVSQDLALAVAVAAATVIGAVVVAIRTDLDLARRVRRREEQARARAAAAAAAPEDPANAEDGGATRPCAGDAARPSAGGAAQPALELAGGPGQARSGR